MFGGSTVAAEMTYDTGIISHCTNEKKRMNDNLPEALLCDLRVALDIQQHPAHLHHQTRFFLVHRDWDMHHAAVAATIIAQWPLDMIAAKLADLLVLCGIVGRSFVRHFEVAAKP